MLTPIVYSGQIPDETARVAHAAYPHGTLCMRLFDVLSHLCQEADFTAVYAATGQPSYDPVRLAIITILQFLEGLSDRQAADMVRGRIDWKLVLCLDLTDPGCDHTVLSEFRSRLIQGGQESLLFDKLLSCLHDAGLVKGGGRQRTDSTHVLAAVRQLNRLERVIETVRATLNVVATVAPDWVRQRIPLSWVERYDHRADQYHLPKAKTEQEVLAREIGANGQCLLAWIDEATEFPWLRELPMVATLRRLWEEQFIADGATLRWRAVKEMPSYCEQIASPYDPEARWATKGSTQWVGFKVHFTETCDDEAPRLITHVVTTAANGSNDAVVPLIHADLQTRRLAPVEHLVDTGYTDAENLATSERQHGVTLLGPVTRDPSWQAKAGAGYAKGQFEVLWDQEQVRCPQGKLSQSWKPYVNARQYIDGALVSFSLRDCRACPALSLCTTHPPRMLVFPPRQDYEAMERRRREQMTAQFKERYRMRAGIESTHAQALRRCDVRHARYLGEAKTRLQMALTATAINLIRLDDWRQEHRPAPTRHARFVRVLAA